MVRMQIREETCNVGLGSLEDNEGVTELDVLI